MLIFFAHYFRANLSISLQNNRPASCICTKSNCIRGMMRCRVVTSHALITNLYLNIMEVILAG